MNNALRLQAAYVGGTTKRWHAEDIIGEQRVNSHTWGMLAMYFILCPEPSLDVVRAITFHDAPEPWSGDAPWFAKQAHPAMAAADVEIGKRWFMAVGTGGEPSTFTPEELWWLETLDGGEAYFFAKWQIAQGNKLMTDVAMACISRLEAARNSPHAPIDAFRVVQDIFDTKIGLRLTRDIRELETM